MKKVMDGIKENRGICNILEEETLEAGRCPPSIVLSYKEIEDL